MAFTTWRRLSFATLLWGLAFTSGARGLALTALWGLPFTSGAWGLALTFRRGDWSREQLDVSRCPRTFLGRSIGIGWWRGAHIKFRNRESHFITLRGRVATLNRLAVLRGRFGLNLKPTSSSHGEAVPTR